MFTTRDPLPTPTTSQIPAGWLDSVLPGRRIQFTSTGRLTATTSLHNLAWFSGGAEFTAAVRVCTTARFTSGARLRARNRPDTRTETRFTAAGVFAATARTIILAPFGSSSKLNTGAELNKWCDNFERGNADNLGPGYPTLTTPGGRKSLRLARQRVEMSDDLYGPKQYTSTNRRSMPAASDSVGVEMQIVAPILGVTNASAVPYMAMFLRGNEDGSERVEIRCFRNVKDSPTSFRTELVTVAGGVESVQTHSDLVTGEGCFLRVYGTGNEYTLFIAGQLAFVWTDTDRVVPVDADHRYYGLSGRAYRQLLTINTAFAVGLLCTWETSERVQHR